MQGGLLPISATENIGLSVLMDRLDKSIRQLTNRSQHVFRQGGGDTTGVLYLQV